MNINRLLIIVSATLNAQTTFPLRIISANVGNATPLRSWENKLERAQDVQNARNYIETWKPDIVLLSEIYDASQMKTTNHNGPVLPGNYDFSCGKNITRNTSGQTSWFPPSNDSHEHECVAWNSKVFEMVPSTEQSVYGRDDDWGKNNCNYDFTAHRVILKHKRYKTVINATAVHPNSTKSGCRIYEISNYWSLLVGNYPNSIIAGDWNTDSDSDLQKPASFQTIFSKGNYWGQAIYADDYSANYITGDKHLDHAFSNFGSPCNNCGQYYNGVNLPFGVVLGGYQGHPRMDNGDGFDHRQILMDINVPYIVQPVGQIGLDVKNLAKIQNLPELITNKFVVINQDGVLGYFDYGTLQNVNNNTASTVITGEVKFRSIPLIDSNKILSTDATGNLGYTYFYYLSNAGFNSNPNYTIGLNLSKSIRLKKFEIKPEDASSFYILVVNNAGIIGKRPLTDILK